MIHDDHFKRISIADMLLVPGDPACGGQPREKAAMIAPVFAKQDKAWKKMSTDYFPSDVDGKYICPLRSLYSWPVDIMRGAIDWVYSKRRSVGLGVK